MTCKNARTDASHDALRLRHALSASALLLAVPAAAQNREYALKAQMLRKMVAYVSWPKGTIQRGRTVIKIGVVGDDPFGKQLDKAFGRGLTKGCHVKIVRFPSWTKTKDKKAILACHAVFVSRSERRVLPDIVATTKKHAIWLVSDSPGFAKLGTHLNFYVARSRVRFETHPKAARRHGIQMSSKLLRLGKTVE